MKLEAVTVCVGFSDFLAESVKWNAAHFERWVIVTTPEDRATIELCRRRNLQCVTTREFDRQSDGTFNKGRGISIGLNHLSTDCFVLLLDADVVLPPATRQMLEVAHLDPACIYGADRVSVQSWERWLELQASGYLHDQHGYHLCANFPAGLRPGPRVIRGRHGYVPIGFFQLFHYQEGVHSGYRWKDYPDSHSDAAHSDIKFALHWDRRRRGLIPEIIVVHLESEPAAMGANWKGRTTKRFGPDPGYGPSDPAIPY